MHEAYDVSADRAQAPEALLDRSRMSDARTCTVCPHECRLREGSFGVCGTRTVREGRIVSLSYGQATALALDPIEKKSLARFHPGSLVLSYGSFGCNLRCPFCQNSDISMADAEGRVASAARFVSPEELVERALDLRERGTIGIAYTYNEPLIAPEYLMDCARLAHEAGLVNVAVTNGYVSSDVWADALSHLDALNIDVKCYSEEGYRLLGAPGGLAVVKRSIEAAAAAGVHVEVTTLVVPGLSDDEALFREECAWLSEIDPEIPLHLSRFFPAYRAYREKPTDLAVLERFRSIAEASLAHVYLGNV
ncbi:AmmeMemoRadiSam system radical SAM enzyme [Raoultibacter phocaeensis]|uniref:AmmeMemoRadiSam system radical SAM enzyme n=1 Tax=Raoultibacter phocaeensis TaxID=2479841 RepID=UPI001C578324|nr:AmmeMemoRadiSam system radical SAM enzyme [Raoultibacter phocaeensis]